MIRILQKDNRLTKALFAVIIGAAVVTMVITLVPGIFDNDATTSGIYASVRRPGVFGRFGQAEDIPTTQVNAIAERQLQAQRLPDFALPFMAQRVAQGLIQRAVLKQEAARLHLEVTESDVRNELRTRYAQIFFPGGNFIGEEKYKQLITSQGISVSDFEKDVRDSLLLDRLQSTITGGVTVSDNAVREAFRKQGLKVKFDYALISADDIKKSLNPTDAELEAFFKTNAARYATAVPEARKLSYIAFDVSSLPGGRPQISDADIQSYYNQHLAEYKVEPQVKVRHILISVAPGADAKTDAAAKAKAESLQKQVKGGADFAKLAKENSDDPGSKERGGDLGMVRKGQMVPEFEKQSFSTPVGQTSDVFKTQFGYHFLQVTEKQDERTKPLAEVKDTIRPILEQQKVGGAMQNFANQLAAEAAKQGLAGAAAAHGLKVQTTDYLGADSVIAGVPDGSSMLSKAFSTAKGAAPVSVATGEGFAIFQVDDIHAAHAPAFADWKSHVADDYKADKVPQLLNAKLKALADRARLLNDLKKAAAEEKITVKTSDLVDAAGSVPDVGSMSGPASAAFDLPKGGVSGPINTGANGIVLAVVEKQEPTAEEIAKNFSRTRDAMLNQQRQEVFSVYVTKLVEDYEKAGAIKLNKQAAQTGLQ